MARKDDFNRSVPLPPGLTVTSIEKAIDYVERELAHLVEIYLEQANVFSGMVGIYATRALDANSVYEKHRHTGLAQTRFPDLKKRGSGPNPPPEHCLECKASKRPWAVQSHYDHPGWYIVCGATLSTRRARLSAKSPLLYGGWTSCFLRRRTGSTKRAQPGKEAAGGRTRSESETPPAGSAAARFTNARTLR